MQRRQEAVARARRRTAIIGGVVAGVLVIGGVVWAVAPSGSKKTPAAAAPSASAAASTAATPSASPSYKQWKTEPAMSIDTKATYTATIKLDQGTVTLKLNAAKAPHTVNSFVFLAKQGFFDNVKCHRLTTAGIYVLQCGDPTGTGSGGPGYSFTDENLKAFGSGTQVTYPAGTVAMANSGANTNGSQFFLVYKDSPLAPSYTPFGTITGGLDTLQAIAKKGVQGGGTDGAPAESVVMKSVTTAKS
ncbi:peptidylprolyl isomerase [Streptacidiphilus monticola]|uniref:Peptidyl-prolyl cis-trans isomerase n=1 Tax=Streptacidiphilus monticola TaxID=2161674 RepID=A0ABW1G8I7_9ACTN